jgi:hypothetical protein
VASLPGALPLNRQMPRAADHRGARPVVADPEGEIAKDIRCSGAAGGQSQWRARAKDYSSKFPTITISRET